MQLFIFYHIIFLFSIEIKTLLETKYGLKVTIEKKEPSEEDKKKDEDVIIGQSLEPGTKVKKGEQLILYVPDIVDEFPDMAAEGWNLSDVETFCNEYGLILEKTEQETTAYAEGTVISQSRTVGTKIVKGTTLKVTIAKKPTAKQPNNTEDENKDEGKTE